MGKDESYRRLELKACDFGAMPPVNRKGILLQS